MAAVRALSPRAIAVVTGYDADAVERGLGGARRDLRAPGSPRGTGDAARVALAVLPPDGVTLVAWATFR